MTLTQFSDQDAWFIPQPYLPLIGWRPSAGFINPQLSFSLWIKQTQDSIMLMQLWWRLNDFPNILLTQSTKKL